MSAVFKGRDSLDQRRATGYLSDPSDVCWVEDRIPGMSNSESISNPEDIKLSLETSREGSTKLAVSDILVSENVVTPAGRDLQNNDLQSHERKSSRSVTKESDEKKPNEGSTAQSSSALSRAEQDPVVTRSPETKISNERRYALRCSPERLSGETSRQDRRELASAFTHVMRLRLAEGRSIYLEGLGVIFIESHELSRGYVLGAQLAVRRETIAKLNFERAGELSPFIRERYHAPLELGDVFNDTYRHLPLPLQLRWTPMQMRFYLGGLIALLRREIVLDGFSHRFAPFCSFFSLHNRHGDSTVDWFAGADIFLQSDFESVKKVEQPRLMERACFDSIIEYGEVALGARKHLFPLNISQALNDIGVSCSRSFFPEIEVVVFERAPGRLAFLTRGAKDISLSGGGALGAEFVIDCEMPQLATWPFTVIATLIERAASGALTNASGINVVAVPAAAFGAEASASSNNSGIAKQGNANSEYGDNFSSFWGGVLLSQGSAHEQILLNDGSQVRLLWATPLLEAERNLAERRTAGHLAALLARKGVLQNARLNRASVLVRTEVL